jgi:formate dehydrogenase subunit beta
MELVKLKQADLANVILIGMDCAGTFSINDYMELSREKNSTDLFLSLLEGDLLTEKLRTACQTCREPLPEFCDILIGVYGADISTGLLVQAKTGKGEKILEGMPLKQGADEERRAQAVQRLKEKRKEADRKFREEYGSIKGIAEILKFYAKCINCQNCRRVCPICYCQECFFCSEHLAQTSEGLVRKSRARGAFKMPLDTLLFHTGRMNHMILSCVECGLCEQACPVNIPLMQVLKRVAFEAQEKFGYSPGRSLEEEIPLTVFREDEFKEVGEE